MQVQLLPLCLHQLVSNPGSMLQQPGIASGLQGDEGAAVLFSQLQLERPFSELVFQGGISHTSAFAYTRGVDVMWRQCHGAQYRPWVLPCRCNTTHAATPHRLCPAGCDWLCQCIVGIVQLRTATIVLQHTPSVCGVDLHAGGFSVSDVHGWLGGILPGISQQLSSSSSSSNYLLFKQQDTGTLLGCVYGQGQATFIW